MDVVVDRCLPERKVALSHRRVAQRMKSLRAGSQNEGKAYNTMINAGFDDAWTEAGSGAGLTCCQGPDLLNAVSTLDSRIDLVLFRAGEAPLVLKPLAAVDVDVVGDEQSDRTPSGLWPSDHAGVVATLRLGQP